MTTDFERWLAGNDQYLADALGWLRARLERFATEGDAAAPGTTSAAAGATPGATSGTTPAPAAPPKPVTRSLFERVLKPSGSGKGDPAALPATGSQTTAQPAPSAPADADAQRLDHPPALVLLASRLGLSTFERNLLLLCAAMEIDTRTAALCARAQRDPSKPYPTFALALALFEQPTWDVLSPERPLRYWRLIEISQPGMQPLTASALRVDERIVNYIKGLNYLDDRLALLLTPLASSSEGDELAASQAAAADQIVRATQRTPGTEQVTLIQLLGGESVSKRTVAERAAERLGVHAYRLSADSVPSAAADLDTFVRLWQRERVLLPLALYVDASDTDKSDPQAAAIRRCLNRSGGLTFLDTRDPWPGIERPALRLEIEKPTPSEQREAWASILGAAVPEQPQALAGQFSFDLPSIRRIARAAVAQAPTSTQSLASCVWQACLASARPALDQLAQRIEPKATWRALKLPKQDEELLRQLTDQVRRRGVVYDSYGFRAQMSRGLGISVLFAGESGTGKTMAAEVIANDLGLLLYRIDLSNVVSKYIGETEKNLRKLFDAAEDGGAILFFDEADALFGKRSEVKDSHDRYANIEINYLLQRMEAYRGLAILATNMKSALDTAFMRRLRFIVNFPFPSAADRRKIWETVFPAETRIDKLDYDRLAKLNLTGGSIQNVALNSAFLAARDDAPISMPLVLAAAHAEFRKLEKPINEADFRWTEAARGSA